MNKGGQGQNFLNKLHTQEHSGVTKNKNKSLVIKLCKEGLIINYIKPLNLNCFVVENFGWNQPKPVRQEKLIYLFDLLRAQIDAITSLETIECYSPQVLNNLIISVKDKPQA